MIVTCPSCEASFAVDDTLIGERGRKVRCGACAHRWHQLPEEGAATSPSADVPEDSGTPQPVAADQAAAATDDASAPEPPSFPAETALEDLPPPVRGPKPIFSGEEDVLDDSERRFAVLGWSIFLVVFVLLACGFYFGQSRIVALEPRFQKLYDLVGLSGHTGDGPMAEVPGEGLAIPADKLLKSRKRVDGDPMILVEGVVTNETQEEKGIPTLRATIANAEAEILARWYFDADAPRIGPGGEVSFGTSIADSWGRQGIGISIIFVSQETAQNEPSILPNGAVR